MKQNRGSSLLEVMIGLFVLAIGLLGMLAMQNKALRENNNAYLYSQGVFLANDIVERIRANRDQFSAYVTDVGEMPDVVWAGTDCQTTPCTPAQMALWDIQTWKTDVVALLPQGKAEVRVNGNDVTVTVEFDDASDADKGTAISMSTTI